MAGRAIEYGDGEAVGHVQRGDFKTAYVRAKEYHPFAAGQTLFYVFPAIKVFH